MHLLVHNQDGLLQGDVSDCLQRDPWPRMAVHGAAICRATARNEDVQIGRHHCKRGSGQAPGLFFLRRMLILCRYSVQPLVDAPSSDSPAPEGSHNCTR